MKIEWVATLRDFVKKPNYDLIYEWEDIIAKKLNVQFVKMNPKFTRLLNIICWFNLCKHKKVTFGFELSAYTKPRYLNNKNFIPCIIDFFVSPHEIKSFEKAYCNNPVVFISSKEAFDYLVENGCKLNIKHLPLSLSDIYKIDNSLENTKKEYDLVLMGRQNTVLESFLKAYIERYPNFKYVYRKIIGDEFLYYTSDGIELGNIKTRCQFLSLMKKAKCGLYSTPGIDGGEKRSKGFNQVTPRFLELIACGCHILARYKENSDTNFYQLNKFSPSINTYEEFESLLNEKLNSPVDFNFYKSYLSQHYTSCRVESMQKFLNNI